MRRQIRRSVNVVILLIFVAPAYAKTLEASDTADAQDSMDKLFDKLVDKLLDRTHETWPLDQDSLDDTMLGKPGHLRLRQAHLLPCGRSYSGNAFVRDHHSRSGNAFSPLPLEGGPVPLARIMTDHCHRVDVRVSASEDANDRSVVEIPTSLNKTPMLRAKRRWFYDDLTDSVLDAIAAGKTRVTTQMTIPETNPQGDVYRVGTMLEMVRELATALAGTGTGNKTVRVCVQKGMGEGVRTAMPLILNGVPQLLKMMDWGEDAELIKIGEIGKDVPQPEDAAFILIQPKNIVGYCVLPYIQEMMEVVGDRPAVMINPDLTDIPSSGGIMSVRGRGDRQKYIDSWEEVHHFRLLYKKPAFYPVYGVVRKPFGGDWELYRRQGSVREENEVYEFKKFFPKEPSPAEITKLVTDIFLGGA